MADASLDAVPMMTRSEAADGALNRTLLVGGILLIAGAVLGFASPSMLSMPAVVRVIVHWSATAAFSAALLVYAFGLGRGGSIVARKPLGVAAMVVLAVWPLVERILTLAVPFSEATTEFYRAWGWAAVAVRLMAAIVIVVQISRAGVIRGRLRWAPMWALVAVAAPQVIAQLVIVATGVDLSRTDDDPVILVLGLGMLTAFAAPVVLGILSIVHASLRTRQQITEAVQVYPPA